MRAVNDRERLCLERGPGKRFGHHMAFHDGRLYVGFGSDGVGPLFDVWYYDLTTVLQARNQTLELQDVLTAGACPDSKARPEGLGWNYVTLYNDRSEVVRLNESRVDSAATQLPETTRWLIHGGGGCYGPLTNSCLEIDLVSHECRCFRVPLATSDADALGRSSAGRSSAGRSSAGRSSAGRSSMFDEVSAEVESSVAGCETEAAPRRILQGLRGHALVALSKDMVLVLGGLTSKARPSQAAYVLQANPSGWHMRKRTPARLPTNYLQSTASLFTYNAEETVDEKAPGDKASTNGHKQPAGGAAGRENEAPERGEKGGVREGAERGREEAQGGEDYVRDNVQDNVHDYVRDNVQDYVRDNVQDYVRDDVQDNVQDEVTRKEQEARKHGAELGVEPASLRSKAPYRQFLLGSSEEPTSDRDERSWYEVDTSIGRDQPSVGRKSTDRESTGRGSSSTGGRGSVAGRDHHLDLSRLRIPIFPQNKSVSKYDQKTDDGSSDDHELEFLRSRCKELQVENNRLRRRIFDLEKKLINH
ncbi:hypothetical protein GNI_126990 [Gregarina niphandrodes]|uniref:Kelch repeat protein n=1 Tax=Gregarina niphandrodes TaxID=110365 RepID=A0A023B1Y9_GRENI|nr:hypothetical protein GNI_126990 [Gregarina niphandrodes]EZG49479.1 hypothetical protein GNI_126990 [Gregarina niphandrodes]|eukprot:XP_011132038.1 hypothetical protein GNI_126990 [Gregarina niphandrodes]